MEPISRKDAKAAGLKYYFTGNPCSHRNVAQRTTAHKECQCDAHKSAVAVRSRKSYLRNKDEVQVRRREYNAQNAEQIAAAKAEYYLKNKSRIDQRNKAYAAANPQKMADGQRKFRERNPGLAAKEAMARHAAKLRATPDWFGELDEFVMSEAYELAKRRETVTGIKWDVDHAIPLRGKSVCGLHVWNNIQVIPASVNRRKSNKFSMEAH